MRRANKSAMEGYSMRRAKTNWSIEGCSVAIYSLVKTIEAAVFFSPYKFMTPSIL